MAGEEGACVAGVCVVGTCVFMVGGRAWLRHVWLGACMTGMGVYVAGGLAWLVGGLFNGKGICKAGVHAWLGRGYVWCVVCVCLHGWGECMAGRGYVWSGLCMAYLQQNSPFRTTFNSQSG